MAYPQRHGGGFDPNNPHGLSSGPTPVRQQHGGGFDPSNPYGNGQPQSNTRSQHGGGYTSSQYQTSAPQAIAHQTQYYQNAQMNQSRPMDIHPAAQSQPTVSQPGSVEKGIYVSSADVDEYNGNGAYHRRHDFRLRGYRHIFDSYTIFYWRWRYPHLIRQPSLRYAAPDTQYRHRDYFSRERFHAYDDRYISCWDGKIKNLVVQATDDVYDNTANSTWKRTFIRNCSPFYLRLANWPMSHVDYRKGVRDGDWPLLVAKWFVASLAIICVVGTPVSTAEGVVRNGGGFDPFPYKHFCYPKVARNVLEDASPADRRLTQTVNPTVERILRPRYLCFLREPGQKAFVMLVEEWITQYKSERTLSYIFVAYTSAQFNHDSPEDMIALHEIAEAAARAAGVAAYWIGCSCMPEPENMQEDVYRISDVIRGAQSLVIAVGPSYLNTSISTTDEMLQQWGTRVWTFPEVLLSPRGEDIKVYTRGADFSSPTPLAKNQFAARVWKYDASVSRQLIDHYEGSLLLSPLELSTLALQCLQTRHTTSYFAGDHSYALMGLMRVRPSVSADDSAFQAFARLSLANDSDMLLERLLCTLPRDPAQPWWSMDDAYEAKLWDIQPLGEVQVAGIGADDTVILDGCFAASVRWKGFRPVAYTGVKSWKRMAAKMVVHTSGYVLVFALALLAVRQTAPGLFFLVYALVLTFASPYCLRVMYQGKFWGQQAWFMGFEGYLDIETVERQIFGAGLGRLRWSAFGSPLCRHHRNEWNEYVADDPCSDPRTRELVERAKTSAPGEQKIFTLVDTHSMTVTLFQAARPPIAFLLAGQEGGMQRAIGVSYDWPTATLYRETVLRMETPILDSMRRVAKVKIGIKRPMMPTVQV